MQGKDSKIVAAKSPSQMKELLFFDNLALHYLTREIPPRVLARAFLTVDQRLSGSILGILSKDQRELLHLLMMKENDGDDKKNSESADGLLTMAKELVEKGLIQKKGPHYYGVAAADQS